MGAVGAGGGSMTQWIACLILDHDTTLVRNAALEFFFRKVINVAELNNHRALLKVRGHNAKNLIVH